MPSETRTATLECAGNSRVFLVPQADGAQWELGAVGNAEWTGVPLAVLLEQAGLKGDVCEIVLEGADRGTPKEPPIPPNPIAYARSLQRDKAMQREVLVAYQMNGRDLQRDHGYPVRAIVPGHYGMASVKWLTMIRAVREPFRGYWQTSDYGYWDDLEGQPIRTRAGGDTGEIRDRTPRSLRDARTEHVVYDRRRGMGGRDRGDRDRREHRRRRNLVSCGVHRPPSTACLATLETRLAHSREAGTIHPLGPRKDASGCIQPDRHDPNYGSYVINYPLPIDVFVEDRGP